MESKVLSMRLSKETLDQIEIAKDKLSKYPCYECIDLKMDLL